MRDIQRAEDITLDSEQFKGDLMNTQTVDTMIARVEYALDDAPGGEKAWVPLRRGDLVTMLRLLKVMPVMVDAAIQVMATLGADAGISATAIVGGDQHPHGANGQNGAPAAVVSAWPIHVIPAPLQEAVTTVTEGPTVWATLPEDLAVLSEQLAAGEVSWLKTARPARLALVDAVIQELAGDDGELSPAEYDAKRPAYMPTARGLYKMCELSWSQLLEKALHPRSGYAPKEVAVAPADSFRG